ncbi:hypothetical protein GCM10010430_10870 [Kitasatospora cystarginea]|uniref:Uncharacterized protein n=1 Tax=Kitasatospora cystarginea TaxID=58350 RepID=A0ABN3DIL4_9ACTN
MTPRNPGRTVCDIPPGHTVRPVNRCTSEPKYRTSSTRQQLPSSGRSVGSPVSTARPVRLRTADGAPPGPSAARTTPPVECQLPGTGRSVGFPVSTGRPATPFLARHDR